MRPDGRRGRGEIALELKLRKLSEIEAGSEADAIAESAATRSIVTYQRHNCSRKHRTYAAFAKCAFKKAKLGVYGEGPYATLSCPKYEPKLYLYGDYSVYLHETEDEARNAARGIDSTGCGGGCQRNNWKGHKIVRLALPE